MSDLAEALKEALRQAASEHEIDALAREQGEAVAKMARAGGQERIDAIHIRNLAHWRRCSLRADAAEKRARRSS